VSRFAATSISTWSSVLGDFLGADLFPTGDVIYISLLSDVAVVAL